MTLLPDLSSPTMFVFPSLTVSTLRRSDSMYGVESSLLRSRTSSYSKDRATLDSGFLFRAMNDMIFDFFLDFER